MKSKLSICRLALLGIPFLLLNSVALAQDADKEKEAPKIAETERVAEEKSEAKLAEETAKRARKDAERAKEVAKRAKEAAEDAKKVADDAKKVADDAKKAAEDTKEDAEDTKKDVEDARKDVAQAKEVAKRAKEAAEDAKIVAGRAEKAAEDAEKVAVRAEKIAEKKKAQAAKRGKEDEEDEKSPTPEKSPKSPKSPQEEPKHPAEKPETPTEPGVSEKPETPAKERGRERRERPARPAVPTSDEIKPPEDPAEPRKPGKKMKPKGSDTQPEKEVSPEPDDPEERENAETPATEPERLAETEVTEVTREVQRELDQRKTRIEGHKEAQALIDEILGAKSRISRAEIAREERFRPRIERQHRGEKRRPKVSPDQRRAATTYYQERLRGREIEGQPPEFFRRSEHRRDRRDPRFEEQAEIVRPRYFNEGRRYVHFDSRSAIPAILMAAQAMNHVRFQPTREVAPIFYGRQKTPTTYDMPLPPENYRNEDSWVVSYPVDENSMISSEDVLFLQGSTQFSDPYSYDVIGVMADAMKALPEEERFVIEGHASAEGSYDSNMILSQQRAEYIVREIVRRGVSPYRLLPVGYGESEARSRADAAEFLRSQDRRVVVFRMKPEPIARR